MKLTRQHFEFIADEFAPLLGWANDVETMTDALKRTNPNFDAEKFKKRAYKNWEAKAEREGLYHG